MADVEYIAGERLSEGISCPTDRCGGYLHYSPFAEGLLCSTCKTEWRGR